MLAVKSERAILDPPSWIYFFTSRVTGIFEISTEFSNLHVSFEDRQRDFRVPVEISLVFCRYKAMNLSFSLKH